MGNQPLLSTGVVDGVASYCTNLLPLGIYDKAASSIPHRHANERHERTADRDVVPPRHEPFCCRMLLCWSWCNFVTLANCEASWCIEVVPKGKEERAARLRVDQAGQPSSIFARSGLEPSSCDDDSTIGPHTIPKPTLPQRPIFYLHSFLNTLHLNSPFSIPVLIHAELMVLSQHASDQQNYIPIFPPTSRARFINVSALSLPGSATTVGFPSCAWPPMFWCRGMSPRKVIS